MKQKILFSTFILLSGFIIFDGYHNKAYTYTSGAPGGYSGAPGEATCATGCHGGTSTAKQNWITSDIDTSIGYTPGTKYTITATITNTRSNVSGFEILALNSLNKNTGTMSLISSANTRLISGSAGKKYIIQSSSGTSLKTWTFNWIAPASGTGKITFYGSFNAANGDGSDRGDVIYTSNLAIKENTSVTAINEAVKAKVSVLIYPNPSAENVNITFNLDRTSKVKITLCDILGQTIRSIYEGTENEGQYFNNFNLSDISSGTYFVHTKINNSISVNKLVIL